MIHSAEEFVRLRLSDNPDEYLKAAWEEAPLTVWIKVIEQYPDMRFWVAHNKTVPLGVLEILADDPCWRVRHMVASKNKLPEHIQLKLAKDGDFSVRQRIVYNKKASLSVLQILAQDVDEEIRKHAVIRIAAIEGR
ncbi:HEAT repeat domain-containing protein [Gorillibacterium sp. sgz5001074]|uniref:HEAT repeat domain-containing protein n=1 Tax=Gorillibacterium sp. sgz5001074 TaxID=3446695 RepID=UPI003F664FB5